MPYIIAKVPFKLGLSAEARKITPGRHFLDESEMSLWFIPGMIAAGEIVVEEESKPGKLNYNVSVFPPIKEGGGIVQEGPQPGPIIGPAPEPEPAKTEADNTGDIPEQGEGAPAVESEAPAAAEENVTEEQAPPPAEKKSRKRRV